MTAGHALLGRVAPVKLVTSLAALTLVGVLAVAGTRAGLSDTTESPGTEFNAGEIGLADNGSGSFLYQVDNALPDHPPTQACIRVSYTGTPDLGSTVKLYMSTPVGDVGPYVDLRIEVGTQTTAVFPDCSGFTASGTIFSGTLTQFQTTHGSAGTGLAYSPRGTEPWAPDDTVVYRMTLDLQDVARPTGHNFSGPHTYTWRADTV